MGGANNDNEDDRGNEGPDEMSVISQPAGLLVTIVILTVITGES